MNCKIDGCNLPTAGQSKYCFNHRAESRIRWKAMIGQKAEEKEKREQDFKELWERAVEAGREEVKLAKPRMITIEGGAYAPFPICGFAWVNVRPGNCAFANWLKKNGHAKADSYSGGVKIWISDYGQSCDLKYAYARGMAKVFSAAGIKAYAESRLD